MELFEQSNTFNKTNRQRLLVDRTIRRPSFHNVDDNDTELKNLSVDVYTSKHLITTGKSILPYSSRSRLDELLLPSINKDINHDENSRLRKRKRPSYHKSLYHSYSSNLSQVDLAELSARDMKPESKKITVRMPIIRDDDTIVNFQRNHVPPPSPSDNEIERLLYELQDTNQSRPLSRQTHIEKEGYIPFRLPVLNQPTRFRHKQTNSSFKNVRTTLSNYLRKYY